MATSNDRFREFLERNRRGEPIRIEPHEYEEVAMLVTQLESTLSARCNNTN